ncbi:MAG TPA: thiamine pyrophosphate-dependent dehydrogenase E1 component subunit alpha [Candidatus Limnocylindrales bacterium]
MSDAVSDQRQRHLGDGVGLTDEQLLGMYRTIALARALDQRMWVLNRAGRAAFVISGQGHEGAQVGIVAALRPGHDWMVPYYRSIAAVLAFGMSPRDVMLGQFGKAADPSSGGRQMPAHYGHAGHNILTSSSPVGTQILHAAGIALAARVRDTDQVAITFMGEGSSNQGDVHEGLNFAAIHRLPLILVVENNGYSISVPAEKELARPDVADRASGYGIPGVVVDGADVLGAYAAARTAVDRARAGDGPTLIEAKVTRLTSHSSDDQESKYRSPEDLAAAKARDPLPRFREQLARAGVLVPERERELADEIASVVDDAADWAEAQPDPTPDSALRHVFAEGGEA